MSVILRLDKSILQIFSRFVNIKTFNILSFVTLTSLILEPHQNICMNTCGMNSIESASEPVGCQLSDTFSTMLIRHFKKFYGLFSKPEFLFLPTMITPPCLMIFALWVKKHVHWTKVEIFSRTDLLLSLKRVRCVFCCF